MDYTRSEAKAWGLEKIKGFYQCPISPVGPDLKIDEEGLRENIEKFIEIGIDGLVVGGFISEGWNLTQADWMRYHEVVADAAKGRLPLWTIILDPCVHTAVEKMNFVEKVGFDGAPLDALYDPTGERVSTMSCVVQHGSRLYLGNLAGDFVSVVDLGS